MPQALDSLPPPAVEWRRESDVERRERLERSGVLSPQPKGVKGPGNSSSASSGSGAWAVEKFVAAAQAQRNAAKNSYSLWCGVDLARWHSIKSPFGTSNVTDGSFGLNFEVTHPQWQIMDAQLGFGPKAVFYHGGQYANLNEPPFSGRGFARFSSGEFGLQATLTLSLIHI